MFRYIEFISISATDWSSLNVLYIDKYIPAILSGPSVKTVWPLYILCYLDIDECISGSYDCDVNANWRFEFASTNASGVSSSIPHHVTKHPRNAREDKF